MVSLQGPKRALGLSGGSAVVGLSLLLGAAGAGATGGVTPIGMGVSKKERGR